MLADVYAVPGFGGIVDTIFVTCLHFGYLRLKLNDFPLLGINQFGGCVTMVLFCFELFI